MSVKCRYCAPNYDRPPCVRSYERLSLNVSTDNSHSSSDKVIGKATQTTNYSFPKNVVYGVLIVWAAEAYHSLCHSNYRKGCENFCTLVGLYPKERLYLSCRTDNTQYFSKYYVTAHCVTVRDYLPNLTWYFEYLYDHLSGLVYKRRRNWIDCITLYCVTKPVTELYSSNKYFRGRALWLANVTSEGTCRPRSRFYSKNPVRLSFIVECIVILEGTETPSNEVQNMLPYFS